MIRRPRRAVPASLVALVIVAICVLTVISVIQHLAGHPPLIPLAAIARRVRPLRMDSTTVVTSGAIAAGLGLILLACAVLPGRAMTLPLAAGPGGAAASPGAAVTRSGLRTALAASAGDVDGVASVRVRVRRRCVMAAVRTELADTAAVRADVEQALARRLSQTGLARPPGLRVAVRFAAGKAAA